MQAKERAAIEFGLRWSSAQANHHDRVHMETVDFWRDILPGELERNLAGLDAGESCRMHFGAGELVPPQEKKQVRTFDQALFDSSSMGRMVVPRLGRFYPQGIAHGGLGCFRQTLTPFRVIDSTGSTITVDTNHPLAPYPLTLEARVLVRKRSRTERGGSCNDLAEGLTADGPGMQAAYPEIATDFYSHYPFSRANEAPDAQFYHRPRLVNHLDDIAINQIRQLYGRHLGHHTDILDLMSSWVSHLPDSLHSLRVTGLGMNREELEANVRLETRIVHDLNNTPILPFAADSFNAVICTASIEYLTRPIEVLTEVARVIRPGGICIITFSDRWFPGKEIAPWSDLHPFERLGLVLDFFVQTQAFTDLHTETIRGLPRPHSDKYFPERSTADPVFAVWGTAI